MRRITTIISAALLALGLMAAPAMAAPADGRCVSNGVQALTGPQKAAAAKGELPGALNGFNAIPFVINDHLRNDANVTEGYLGLSDGDIC